MTDDSVAKALQETSQKAEVSLIQAIQEHVRCPDYSAGHGVDFLQVKNSLMLSYLIELTNNLRNDLLSNSPTDASVRRFSTMKVVLDKSRGLEKKLRYQIEKLVSSGTTSTSFAAQEDPLHFRPDTSALRDEHNDGENQASSGQDESENEGSASNDSEESSVDADLEAARATISESRGKASQKKHSKEEETDDGIYRAPRLAAVPYNLDQTDKKAEKEKRQLRRMRASELAQTLLSQYGDAPEQEDIHGGSELGRQREAARRFEQMQQEKTKYEEDTMVRLAVTRNEKKERKRLLREESSNLGAIAELGNIVRDTAAIGNEGKQRHSVRDSSDALKSGSFGKRKRNNHFDHDEKRPDRDKRKSFKPKNQLQADLFGSNNSKSKKNRKR